MIPPLHFDDSTPSTPTGCYSVDMLREMHHGLIDARQSLLDLQTETLQAAQALPDSLCQQHLRFGVARRASYMRRIIGNIFDLFPPDARAALPPDEIANATINLHALLMHLAGIWDNWAWAYLLQHNRVPKSPLDVGIFKPRILQLLPKALRDWLEQERVTKWRREHAFDNRHALAHQIPPYIPPSQGTREQGADIQQHIDELAAQGRQVEAMDAVVDSASTLRPCFFFLHAFTGEKQGIVYLHPQVILDAQLVSEFGRLFLQHWLTPTS